MLNSSKGTPIPPSMQESRKTPPETGAPAAPAATPSEKTLAQLRDLLVGNMRQEVNDQVDHLGDQFADFEQYVRAEFRKITEDIRASDRRQEDHRRQALKDISAAMDMMAQNVRRLSE